MKKLMLLPFCLISLISLIACAAQENSQMNNGTDSADTQLQLQAAEVKWQKNQPTHYIYKLQPSCYCTQEYNKPIEIDVVNGNVQQAVLLPEKTPLPKERKDDALTVEGLFKLIHKAIENKAAKIEAKYDKQYGYPVSIAIDWDKMMADEETYYKASDLAAQ